RDLSLPVFLSIYRGQFSSGGGPQGRGREDRGGRWGETRRGIGRAQPSRVVAGTTAGGKVTTRPRHGQPGRQAGAHGVGAQCSRKADTADNKFDLLSQIYANFKRSSNESVLKSQFQLMTAVGKGIAVIVIGGICYFIFH
ncbi:unnamed protein product, partial [Urochloa humidicola]